MKSPLFVIGFTFFLTLLVANTFGIVASCMLLAITAIIFLTFIISSKGNLNKVILYVFISAIIGFISYSSYMYVNVLPVRELDNQDAIITGTLIELPTQSNGRYEYTIETDSVLIDSAPQNIKIKVTTSKALDIQPYERIHGKVHFYLPSDDGNSFTSRNYYDSKGIYVKAFLYEYEDYSIMPRVNSPPYYYALQVRQSIVNSINSMIPQKESSLLNATMLGQKQGLSDDVKNDFRIDGVSHILAVSGLHISVLAMALLSLLIMLKLSKKLSCIITSIFIFCFMAITGFVPSVMRAGIMAIILYLGVAFAKKSDTLNSLGASVIIICLMNPLSGGDIGLVLSFFATLGIITISKFIYNYMNNKTKRFNNRLKRIDSINKVVATTLAAVIFTLPFTIISFGTISLIAPISNILLVTPMSLMMIFGIVSAILNIFKLTILAMPIAFIAKLLADYSLFMSNILAKIPIASISARESFVLIIISGILILIATLIYLGKNKKLIRLSAILSVFIVLSGIISYQVFNSFNTTDVTVISTGTSSSVSLQQNGYNALICCGGNDKTATSIQYYLDSARVKNLDFLLLPDASDNSSGAGGKIIEKYTPSVLLLNDSCKKEEKIARTLNDNNAEYFNKEAYINILDNIQVEVKSEGEKSFIAFNAYDKSFLICPNGGDVKDVPESWRNCNFFITSKLPKNPQLISCDYLIMSMYEDDMQKSITSNIPIAQEIINTGENGNIQISIKNNGIVTISVK